MGPAPEAREGGQIGDVAMKMTKEAKAELRAEFAQCFSEKIADCAVKDTGGFVEIGGVVVTEDKPAIKTSFWFGEHNYEDRTQEAADASESVEFFVRENLGGCSAKRKLDVLDGETVTAYRHPVVIWGEYLGQPETCRLGRVAFANCNGETRGREGERGRMMGPEEVERYREFLADEVAKFEKRLRAYLKRYGLGKCSYSTYWADR